MFDISVTYKYADYIIKLSHIFTLCKYMNILLYRLIYTLVLYKLCSF